MLGCKREEDGTFRTSEKCCYAIWMYDFETFEADQTMYNFYEIDKSVKLTLDSWFNFVHSDDFFNNLHLGKPNI